MVLESLEPKGNDKILKKNFFNILGGFGPPQNPQKNKNGGFGGSKPTIFLYFIIFFGL